MAEARGNAEDLPRVHVGFELPAGVLDSLVESVAERVAARIGAGATSSPWLTAEQAAAYLGIAKSSLYRLARTGVIPSYQDGPGARVFFHRDEIDQARRSTPAPM